MRTAIIFALLAAAAAACDNQPQPTSPVGVRAATQLTADAGVSGEGIKLPDAKPTDQVGFTKVANYSSDLVSVIAGETEEAAAACPAGSFLTGGGHALTAQGTPPSVLQSWPEGNEWHVKVRNDQAGAQFFAFRAWAVCAS